MGQRLVRRRNRIWLWWLIAIFIATYPLLVFLALYLPWFLFDMAHISLVWHDYIQTLLSVGLFSFPTSLVLVATVTLGIFLGVSATRKIVYIERLRKAAFQNNEQMMQQLLSESKAHIPELPISILAIQPKRVLWGYVFIIFYLWAMIIVIIVAFQTSDESRLAIPLVVPEAIFSLALLNRTRCEVIADTTGIEQRFRWTRKRIAWGDVRLFWKDMVTYPLRAPAKGQATIPPTLYEVASAKQFIILRVADGFYNVNPVMPEFTQAMVQPLLTAIVYMSSVPLHEPLPRPQKTRMRLFRRSII